MSELSNLWCVVPAAGIGQRFGGSPPKQYQLIAGKPVIQRTLDSLLAVNFKAVVVVIHKNDDAWPKLSLSRHPKIVSALGGNERVDSVLAGLNKLTNKASNNDWVLVHDVARPCVSAADINKLIASVTQSSELDGGLLAMPVSDSLKKAQNHCVVETLDRASLWQALTPQMFRYGVLKQALKQSLQRGEKPSDEAAAMEAMGAKVNIVQGRRDNIKITLPEDLAVAQALYEYQQHSGEQ